MHANVSNLSRRTDGVLVLPVCFSTKHPMNPALTKHGPQIHIPAKYGSLSIAASLWAAMHESRSHTMAVSLASRCCTLH